MPSRSVRKRKHKALAWFASLDEPARRAEGRWYLTRWRAEARRRADDLGEPEVWKMEAGERPKALALDPTGELAADLSRICAEAVAMAVGGRLIRGSRPSADRGRVLHVTRRPFV